MGDIVNIGFGEFGFPKDILSRQPAPTLTPLGLALVGQIDP